MIMSRFTFPNDFPLDSSELLMLAYANYKSNKVKSNSLEPTFGTLEFNPISTGLGHVTLIYGLIPPMAGRNRVNLDLANSKSSKI